MPVKNRLAEMQPEIAAWRRDFHAHPEVLYEVHRTAGIVAEKLRGFGCDEVTEGIGRTGVVGVIHGRHGGGRGRVIGLRADMDALPMTELTGLEHASQTPGAMHACGHDGHTAMLLGAAQYLAETRNFDGTVVVIFQPAEEGGQGAVAMLEDGLVDRWAIDEVYGLHNLPGLPVGQFAVRPGPVMAAVDEFVISVTGKGGHGAMPHLAVDTTLVAAQIVVALQSITARNVDPLKSAVVTVAAFHTDSKAFNIIPNEALLRGTVRSFDPAVRDMVEARLRAVTEHTALAFGASARIEYHRHCEPTINADAPSSLAARVAESVAGQVTANLDPLMAGEDFSFMLNARPGAYAFVGNGDSAPVHHPKYDFNDEAIAAGCSWFATLVETRLSSA